MKITIHYMGQVKHASGFASLQEIEVPGPCSVLECVRQLTKLPDSRLRPFLLDGNGQISRTILLFAGDEHVRHAEQVMLGDGAVLTVLSPIAGG